MIDTREVVAFFDRLAAGWDAEMIRNDEVIGIILDNAGVTQGTDILDVACGTGVLIPDYLAREVHSVTAIDISPEMARIAKDKFPRRDVTVICGDVEEAAFDRQFDCVVVYNAFPHFPDPERLIRRLAALVKPGGTLTVAHGMSREKIDAHHHGAAGRVSNGLMSAEALSEIFGRYLTDVRAISNERMYQVAGIAPERARSEKTEDGYRKGAAAGSPRLP